MDPQVFAALFGGRRGWSILKGSRFGLQSDWTRPGDVTYSHQPTIGDLSGAGWSGSGQGQYQHTPGSDTDLAQPEALILGNTYRITYTVTVGEGEGSVSARAGTTAGVDRDESGTFTDQLTCADNTALAFYPSSGFDGVLTIESVENVSVIEAFVKGRGAWTGSKFTQPAAANMPYWDNGLSFDGINDFMQHSGPPEKLHTPDGFTAAFVIEPEITASTGQRVILDQTNNDPTNPGLQVVYNAATQQLTTRVANGVDWTVAGSTWLSRGIPHIVDARWSEAGGLRMSVDDHSVEVEGGVGGVGAAADLQLGRRVGGEYFGGRVSDLVVRQGEVPERDIERWRGRMRGKYSFEGETKYSKQTWMSNKAAQVWKLRPLAGEQCSIDWGDGHRDDISGAGAIVDLTHTFVGAAPYGPIRFENGAKIHTLNMHSNGLAGDCPELGRITSLYICNLFGNLFTGIIPELSACTALFTLTIYGNMLTGYTPSVLATSFTAAYFQNNLLPQTAIDQIIADFHTNLANRPATGTLNLGGSGNAAPSAAGKAKAQEIKEHGWTVTVVGGLD